MSDKKAQSLLYLLDYLNDKNVGELICCIYGVDAFLKPYKSNREMFINILFNNMDKIDYKNESRRYAHHKRRVENDFSEEDIIEEYKKFCNELISDLPPNSYDNTIYSYFRLWYYCQHYGSDKFKLEDLTLENSKKLTNKELSDMTNFFQKFILPIKDYSEINNPFRERILEIVDAFDSFDIKSNEIKNIKENINDFIVWIKDNGCYYKYEKQYEGMNNVILKIYVNPISEDKTTIQPPKLYHIYEHRSRLYLSNPKTKTFTEIADYTLIKPVEHSKKHPLISSSIYSSITNKMKRIHEAVNKIDNESETVCPMCCRKTNGKQRCWDCKEIIRILVEENVPRYNKKGIIKYHIEKKGLFNNPNNLTKRVQHYKNLKILLRNINSFQKIKEQKALELYINRAFGDIKNFNFPKECP